MLFEHRGVRGTVLLEEPRRALDVREEKGDGATRQVASNHAAILSPAAHLPRHRNEHEQGGKPSRAGGTESALAREPGLDHPLVEHRVGDLHEAGDVGADHVVPGYAVLSAVSTALLVDRVHDVLQPRVHLFAWPVSRRASCDISRPETATPPAFAALPDRSRIPRRVNELDCRRASSACSRPR